MYFRDEKIWHRPFREIWPMLVLLLLVVFGGLFALGHYAYHNYHVWEDHVVAATCTAPGYTTHTCRICGISHTDTYTTASHTYSAYITIREPGEETVGIRASYCSGCGDCHLSEIPPTLLLPSVHLDGNIGSMSSDVAVPLQMTYDSYQVFFTATAVARWQGFTAAGFPKKNYNIKLYTDDTLTIHQREDLGFGNWGAQWKYTIKANYIDRSHARNIVSCRLWGQMVRTRENSNPDLLNAPNAGATDGFLIRVWLNGVYTGIYTMNIPKDKWMFGMDEETHPYSAIITSQMHNSTNRFQATTDLYTTQDWDVEYCSTGEDIAWLNESFNNMIRFIRDTSGNAFREGISEYVDVEAAIDYTIMCFAMYGPDNWDKNMVLVTYDGVQWIPCLYDADCSFGLYWAGTYFYTRAEMDQCLPTVVRETSIYTNNWMLSKIAYYFYDEFVDRYWELRDSVLSEENMIAAFEEFENSIPYRFFEEDLRINALPNPIDPANGLENNADQAAAFIEWRMARLDEAMRNLRRA